MLSFSARQSLHNSQREDKAASFAGLFIKLTACGAQQVDMKAVHILFKTGVSV